MERNKTLSYRRADFITQGHEPKTLEAYLTDALEKLENISDRRFEDPGHPVLECRKHSKKTNLGILLHITAHTPGEQASVVPKENEGKTGDVETADPPENCEFMDGDIMVLVANDHVLLCSTNLHEKKAQRYMSRLIEKANPDGEALNFALSRVADINKLKLIQTQGVKSVSIDATIFDASIDHLERKTTKKKITGSLMDQVKAALFKDEQPDDLAAAENLSAHIVLTYDGRSKNKIFGKERIETMAKQLLDDNEDGFTIMTCKGEKIKGDQIALKKSVTLPKHGKSVYCKDAWNALEEYYFELRENGVLEQ